MVTAPLWRDMDALIHRLRAERPKSGPLDADAAVVNLRQAVPD